MLSEKKLLLRSAELIAIASATIALYLAAHTWRTPDPEFPVFLWATGGVSAIFLTSLPSCILASEYIKTVRKPETRRTRTAGLNSMEISALIQCAPPLYKLAAVLGVLLAVGTTLAFGGIQFNSNEPIAPAVTPGLFLSLSVFFLLALPILGSAARMPGNYAAGSEA